MLFLSCKANARVKLAKSGHGPHLFRIIVLCVVLVIVLCYRLYVVLLLLCCTVICVSLLLFVLSYVLIVCTVPLPPGVNPIAVDKYINIYYLVLFLMVGAVLYLYAFFWVILRRLNFIYRRFGTLCLFHLYYICIKSRATRRCLQ